MRASYDVNSAVSLSRRWALMFLLMGSFAGCATYEAQWTPENTQPPPSLPEALVDPTSFVPPPVAEVDDEVYGDLSLDHALRTAFERNRSLAVRQYSPDITRQAIAEAQASFDPNITATVEYHEQARPGTSSSAVATQVGTTGDESLDDAIAAISGLAETTRTIRELVSGAETTVTTSDGLGASVTMSQTASTGTTFTLTGDYLRSGGDDLDSEYTGTWDLRVTQSLLRGFGPDVNLVSVRQARNDAAISEQAFRDYALTLAESVELAYWELALAQETLRIREFSQALAAEQLKLNEALIAVGKLSGSDRVSAEAELAAQEAALVNAKADLQERAIELWQWMNPESQTPSEIRMSPVPLPDIPEIPFAVEGSLALGMQFRPDLAQAHLDVENGTLSVVATKNGLLPRLDAFVSYGTYSSGSTSGAWNDGLSDSTYDQFSAGLTFSMALGNRAEKARYRRALFQADQARAAVHNLEQQVETDIRKAVVELERQQAQITASQQELAMREKELEVETEQFRLGRSTNLDVMQVRRDLVQAKVSEATARVRYLQGVATLYATEGTLLTRRGITVESGEEWNT